MDRLLLDVYGWFAILSAVFTVLTFVSGVLFFTIGEKFGKANDIFSVFQVCGNIHCGSSRFDEYKLKGARRECVRLCLEPERFAPFGWRLPRRCRAKFSGVCLSPENLA